MGKKDTQKKPIDWEKIELDYRVGIKTLRDIAEEHGITHGAINKRAKRDAWVRDLTAKIKARADYLVSEREVSRSVSSEKRILDNQIVEITAAKNAEIITKQSERVDEGLSIVDSMLAELKSQVADKEIYEKLGEIFESQDEKKLSEIYAKVTSFGGRVNNIKTLSDTMKTLTELQRKIRKIDDDGSNKYTFEDFLREERGRSMVG